jgi:hypothetical protein
MTLLSGTDSCAPTFPVRVYVRASLATDRCMPFSLGKINVVFEIFSWRLLAEEDGAPSYDASVAVDETVCRCILYVHAAEHRT